MRLSNPRAGVLKIDTPVVRTEIPVDQIGLEPVVVENGGIRRRLQVSRLPDENPVQRMQARVRVPLHTDSDNAVYLRITTEDGIFIYSSPIYVERTGAGPK